MWTSQDWHRRFTHQTYWTAQVRDYLFGKAHLLAEDPIIEIGCGTGAVLSQLPNHTNRFGLDINQSFLQFAQSSQPEVPLICGDAHTLPLPSNSFKLVCCHFLLLWVADPTQVLKEMKRICRPGGAIIILAEPDYGGRVDHPETLQPLGDAQTKSLRNQGADPFLGRKLPGLLLQAGLTKIEIGIMGSQWLTDADDAQTTSEWDTLQHDLKDHISAARLDHFRKIDSAAWKEGTRVLYVPTFYAFGQKPEEP